ncbi:phosphodiesterase [Streptomyces enissocaesilis]|uniref:Phosphodiesterase n=1 Tax=Streptomyces enissocaesilis TaxID=332589 RepID=A0ABN3X9Q0_9ACTN
MTQDTSTAGKHTKTPTGTGLVARAARSIAHWRHAPALHPFGVSCDGVLAVQPSGPAWGEPWLDTPGDYQVRMRWSRAVGLPGRLPDALGLALRVHGAGGPGRSLDLLLTSSGAGRRTRHLPLPRLDALAGPYSTLLSYRIGEHEALLAAHPDMTSPLVPNGLATLRTTLQAGPLTFRLGAAPPGQGWRALGTLTTGPPHDLPAEDTVSYDPYLNHLPRLHPTARFSGLREAAYAASRAGRRAAGRAGS